MRISSHEPPHERRWLALVLLAPVACWLACWPFAEMPVNDDFSYAFTVKRLLETGRLTYNGWSAPIVGAQAYWGALFCTLFGGFSHLALRASTLPLSIACAGLAYALYRRVGAPPRWAAFGTLVLVCSPLFTPWSASFMTDVPGLAFTLLTFNATLGLARARSTRGVALWATLLLLSAAVGGSIRQTNFLFGCVALALEFVRRRRAWREAGVVGGALAVLAVTMFVAVGWYSRQPYAIADVLVPLNHVARAATSTLALVLTLTMFLLPLGVACVGVARLTRGTLLRVSAACAVACPLALYLGVQNQNDPDVGAICTQVGYAMLGIWSGNTLTATGLLFDGIDAPGDRPVLFGWASRSAIAVAVYWLLALAGIAAWRRRAALAAGARRVLLDRSGRAAQAVASMAACVAVYAALLFPRAGLLVVFDRYLLVVMPVVTAGVLLASRRRLRDAGPGRVAWALVVVYALLGSAITSDHFCELRARARVAAEFEAAGVPRTAIANGLTFDAWTQLLERGFLNEEGVANPPGAFRRDPNEDARVRRFWFLGRTPAVQPRWIIVNTPAPPRELGDRRLYGFTALLPPRQRWLLAWPIRDPAINGGGTP